MEEQIVSLLKKYAIEMLKTGIAPNVLEKYHVVNSEVESILYPTSCEYYYDLGVAGNGAIIVKFTIKQQSEGQLVDIFEEEGTISDIVGVTYLTKHDTEVFSGYVKSTSNIQVGSITNERLTNLFLDILKSVAVIRTPTTTFHDMLGNDTRVNAMNFTGPIVVEEIKENAISTLVSYAKDEVLMKTHMNVHQILSAIPNSDKVRTHVDVKIKRFYANFEDNSWKVYVVYGFNIYTIDKKTPGSFLPEQREMTKNYKFNSNIPYNTEEIQEDVDKSLEKLLNSFVQKFEGQSKRVKNFQITLINNIPLDSKVKGIIVSSTDFDQQGQATLMKVQTVLQQLQELGMTFKTMRKSNTLIEVTIVMEDVSNTLDVKVYLGGNGFTTDLFKFDNLAYIREHHEYGSLKQAISQYIKMYPKYTVLWQKLLTAYDLRRTNIGGN